MLLVLYKYITLVWIFNDSFDTHTCIYILHRYVSKPLKITIILYMNVCACACMRVSVKIIWMRNVLLITRLHR